MRCYKKTKFDFLSTTKILSLFYLPKVTQFQGKKSGTSESLDLVVNLRYMDPDKNFLERSVSSRPIDPNDGARLCLL